MPGDRLEWQLDLNARNFQQGAQQVDRSSSEVDAGIRSLTNGVNALNSAFRVTDATTGRYAKKGSELAQLGVRTTAQVKAEVAALDFLIEKHRTDVVAVQQLTAAREQLNQTMVAGTNQTRHAQQALFSFGFILDDSRQFVYGFDQGMRAIANNLQPVIQQLSYVQGGFKSLAGALKGPAGAILAINGITLAAAIAGPAIAKMLTSETEKQAERAAKALERVKKQMEEIIKLKPLDEQIAEMDTSQLRNVAEHYGRMARSASDQVRELEHTVNLLKPVYSMGAATLVLTQEELLLRRASTAELAKQQNLLNAATTQFTVVNTMLSERLSLQALIEQMMKDGLITTVTETGYLDELLEKQQELTTLLSQMQSIGRLRHGDLLRDIEALEEEIELEEKLARLRSLEVEFPMAFDTEVLQAAADSMFRKPVVIPPDNEFTKAIKKMVAGVPVEIQAEVDALKGYLVGIPQAAGAAIIRANKQLDDALFASTDQIIMKQEQFIKTFQEGIGAIPAAVIEAAASGQNAGAALLSAIGSLAIRLGKIALAAGIGVEAIRKSLMSLRGAPAIAAGLALIALGSFVRGAAKGLASPGGSGGVQRAPVLQGGGGPSFQNRLRGAGAIPVVVGVEVTGTLTSKRGTFDAEIRNTPYRNELLRTPR